MGRPARYIPENKNGVLVEVSCRAIGGRALLSPGPNPFKFNEIVAGVMGRALEVSPLDLCSAIVVSNHYHLLAAIRRDRRWRWAPGPVGSAQIQPQPRPQRRAHRIAAKVARHPRRAPAGPRRITGGLLVQQVERVGGQEPWPVFRYLRLRHPILDQVCPAAGLPAPHAGGVPGSRCRVDPGDRGRVRA